MSQAGVYASSGGGGGSLSTLTGNSGGAVSPTAGTIHVVGDGVTVHVVGNPGSSTLTISASGVSVDTVTYVNTTPYVVLNTDYLLDVDSSGAPLTIQFPDAPVQGQAWIVKDLTGSSATNNITITTVTGLLNFDAASTYTMATNYLSIQVTANSQGNYDITLAYNPASGISTIDTDNGGFVTGSTITMNAAGATLAGATVQLSGGGSLIQLLVSDSDSNLMIGCGNGVNAGEVNTGMGTGSFAALNSNCLNNTGIGGFVLSSLNNGSSNCVLGKGSMSNSTSASSCVVVGAGSLQRLGSGEGCVVLGGGSGLSYTTSESFNILIGSSVPGVVTESNVLRIGSATGTSTGNLNASYICGIQGITVTGTPILISASDQLGIAVSSSRFKKDIQDMGDASYALYKLRPVSFTWDRDSSPGLADATDMTQHGLIAEEVITHVPHVVNLDGEGRAININYTDLIGMMINEMQRLNKRIEVLEGT